MLMGYAYSYFEKGCRKKSARDRNGNSLKAKFLERRLRLSQKKGLESP